MVFDLKILLKEHNDNISKLNKDQLVAYNLVMKAIYAPSDNQQKVFFIDGPGGCGKTFLYKT